LDVIKHTAACGLDVSPNLIQRIEIMGRARESLKRELEEAIRAARRVQDLPEG
jgi:hypothetical protein